MPGLQECATMPGLLYSFSFFLQYGGLNSGLTLWVTTSAIFCDGSFQTICLGWLWMSILLISVSWVAGIQLQRFIKTLLTQMLE
jgi:hypothetical protein